MTRLSAEQVSTIEEALDRAGANLPCPRCGNEARTVLDGYLVDSRQSQLRNLVISGDNRVACAATVCTRCGYLAHHLIDVLGV